MSNISYLTQTCKTLHQGYQGSYGSFTVFCRTYHTKVISNLSVMYAKKNCYPSKFNAMFGKNTRNTVLILKLISFTVNVNWRVNLSKYLWHVCLSKNIEGKLICFEANWYAFYFVIYDYLLFILLQITFL